MRKIFLVGILMTWAISGWSQKNVLIIAIDDLKPLLANYGYDQMITPNIDRLADMGITFTNTSCQQAVCGPSRASLITGLYPDETEVWDLNTLIRDRNPDLITFPQYFKNNGYTTTGAGKMYDPRSVDDDYDAISWSQPYFHSVDKAYYDPTLGDGHSGYQDSRVPTDAAAYEQYLTDNNITSNKDKYEAVKLFPYAKPTTEGLDVPDNAYKDGATTAYVIEKLETLANEENPFFLVAGFSKPHLPFVAPKKYWDLYVRSEIVLAPDQTQAANVTTLAWRNNGELTNSYSDVPLAEDRDLNENEQRKLIHGYMACVSYIDAQIGLLLDKLDALNLTDQTSIVLWGDHGWHLGDHNLWAKHSTMEQAVQVPMIIYDPDHGEGGTTSTSPVELVDIYPTFCELAGLEVPAELQGKSLVKVLDDPTYEVREAAMGQYPRKSGGVSHMGYTLRDQKYRYTKWVRLDYQNGERYGNAVGHQLYDLDADPTESHNLIGNISYDAIVDQFELEFKRRNVAQAKPSSFIAVSTCESAYTSPNGSVYTTSGVYTNVLTAKNGMDSVITIELNVAKQLDIEVDLKFKDGMLTSSVGNLEYSWWDCENATYISAEYGQSFEPKVAGTYAVEVSNGGCTLLSDCLSITLDQNDTVLDIPESKILHVFPTPIGDDGLLHLNLDRSYDNISVSLIDLSGNNLQAWEITNQDKTTLAINQKPGTYLLQIVTRNFQLTSKVVVK